MTGRHGPTLIHVQEREYLFNELRGIAFSLNSLLKKISTVTESIMTVAIKAT
jgi:hypothetical protein